MNHAQHQGQARDQAFEASFQSELHNIQQSLGKTSAHASRVMHSGPLEGFGSQLNTLLLSPIALFIGGFCAMVSAIFITFVATSDGFTANYTLVVISFLIGWLIGGAFNILAKE